MVRDIDKAFLRDSWLILFTTRFNGRSGKYDNNKSKRSEIFMSEKNLPRKWDAEAETCMKWAFKEADF